MFVTTSRAKQTNGTKLLTDVRAAPSSPTPKPSDRRYSRKCHLEGASRAEGFGRELNRTDLACSISRRFKLAERRRDSSSRGALFRMTYRASVAWIPSVSVDEASDCAFG